MDTRIFIILQWLCLVVCVRVATNWYTLHTIVSHVKMPIVICRRCRSHFIYGAFVDGAYGKTFAKRGDVILGFCNRTNHFGRAHINLSALFHIRWLKFILARHFVYARRGCRLCLYTIISSKDEKCALVTNASGLCHSIYFNLASIADFCK